MFAVGAPGVDQPALEAEIRTQLRLRASPRHVPEVVVWCPGLPRTINGKRLEVPIKRLLQGARPEDVVDPGTISHPELLAGLAGLLAASEKE